MAADVDSRKRLEEGDLAFANNLWFGYGAGTTLDDIVDGDFAESFLARPEQRSWLILCLLVSAVLQMEALTLVLT